MAANAGDLKGYDHQFVEPPPDDLLCLICLCVARDPQQINCCGKVLCKGCLEEHKKYSTVCPQCRNVINSFADKRSKYHHKRIVRYMHIIITIPQVSATFFHLKLDVTIHPVAVSGWVSYAHWMSTWLAVISLSYLALINAKMMTRWCSYFVKTCRHTLRRNAHDASTSVLTARRLGSTGR